MSSKDKNKRIVRNVFITIFVIAWSLIFHYESIRHFYLNPLFKKDLPKVKFLYPPAGWIMFFQVGPGHVHIEVEGVKNNALHPIDPHDIFRTRTIMFDNIHRGILGSAGSQHNVRSFCRYLFYRFPEFNQFAVSAIQIREPHKDRYTREKRYLYVCTE